MEALLSEIEVDGGSFLLLCFSLAIDQDQFKATVFFSASSIWSPSSLLLDLGFLF